MGWLAWAVNRDWKVRYKIGPSENKTAEGELATADVIARGDETAMGGGLIITFLPEKTTGEVSEGETILEAAERLGVTLNHECGGVASCSTCRVQISGEARAATLSAVDVDEQEVLEREQLDDTYRLACQARVRGHVTVVIPPSVKPLADQAVPPVRR